MKEKYSNIQVMRDLPKIHDQLVALIGGREFHYVDVPVYGNIGDLLIMHGTLEFFRKNNLFPKTISPFHSFEPSWIKNGDVVLFQGGGNFGDLYEDHQRLRERIIVEKPDNRIIILPQSIYFRDPKRKLHSEKIFRLHSDVHICVRDTESQALALRFSENVYLMPDMAHHLYPIAYNKKKGGREILQLRRVDNEKVAKPELNQNIQDTITDWPILIGRAGTKRLLFFSWLWRKSFGIKRHIKINKIIFFAWKIYSKSLIKKAVNLFGSHQMVITDRLHAHILACLMDKNNVVLDNSYGKNSTYVASWTGISELVSGDFVAQPESPVPRPAIVNG